MSTTKIISSSQPKIRVVIFILAVIAWVATEVFLWKEEPNSCTLTFAFQINNDDCLKLQDHIKRGWLLQVKDGYIELTHPAGVMQGLLRIYKDDKVKQ